MESWAIVVLVAISASFLGGAYRTRVRHQSEIGTRVEAKLVDLGARLEKLEETIEKRDVVQRLNALEAIVTDRRFNLQREIDGLGDD